MAINRAVSMASTEWGNMRSLHDKLTYGVILGSCFMHVFCCGIPLVMSVVNMAALFGIVGGSAFHPEWFENIEVTVLAVAGVMLLISALLQEISRRIDCRQDVGCAHEPCDSKKSFSQRVFKISVVLYAVNLVLFLLVH